MEEINYYLVGDERVIDEGVFFDDEVWLVSRMKEIVKILERYRILVLKVIIRKKLFEEERDVNIIFFKIYIMNVM